MMFDQTLQRPVLQLQNSQAAQLSAAFVHGSHPMPGWDIPHVFSREAAP
jgi:hypothetical protein